MSDSVILVVDDDPDVLDYMKTVLKGGGFKVETAESAEDGLRQFKKLNPALVYCDLMMEEVDSGTNFVKEVKALGSSTPIYMLTSVGDAMSQTINFSDLGLRGMIQKPLKAEQLIKLTRNIVGE